MVEASCVGKVLASTFDGKYVILGLFCAFVGSFVALMMIKFARQALLSGQKRAYVVFVVLSGVELGGAAIWTMHFIGGKALKLRDCNGHEIPKSYEVVLSIASLVAAMVGTSLSVHAVMPQGKAGLEAGVDPQKLANLLAMRGGTGDDDGGTGDEKNDEGPRKLLLQEKKYGANKFLVKVTVPPFLAACISRCRRRRERHHL